MRRSLCAVCLAVYLTLAGCVSGSSDVKTVDGVIAPVEEPTVYDRPAPTVKEELLDLDKVGSNAVSFDDESAESVDESVDTSDVVADASADEQRAYANDFSDTLMIGDSIMVSVEPLVKELMPAVTVNAVGARSLEAGGVDENFDTDKGVLDWLRAGAADGYARVVVGTGSNDTAGVSEAQIEEILEILGDKDVWFVTEYVTNNSVGTDNTNFQIARVVGEGRARSIGWHDAVLGREAELLADNVHPSWNAGRELYAQLVYDALVEDAGVDTNVDGLLENAITMNALLAAPTSDDAIMGRTLTTVDAMAGAFAGAGGAYPSVYAAKGATTIREWCEIVYEESVAEGVRAEIVFAQSMHETGWLRFGGQVSVEQCNFAGIGATNSGGTGATFRDVREGVRAQVQHLKAYASVDPLTNACVDPRFDLVERGCAPTVVDLNGRWAVPGRTYGQQIMKWVDAIVS